MSLPEPLPPRSPDASGGSLPPESFTGGRRDVPAPRDFIPAIARELLQALPAATGAAPRRTEIPKMSPLMEFGFGKPAAGGEENAEAKLFSTGLDLPPFLDLMSPAEKDSLTESPAVGSETASQLQELSGALLAAALPGKEPKVLSASPVPPAKNSLPGSAAPEAPFSLSDLAGRLSSRFVDHPGPDSAKPEAERDLLGGEWEKWDDEPPLEAEAEDLLGPWDGAPAGNSLGESFFEVPPPAAQSSASWADLLTPPGDTAPSPPPPVDPGPPSSPVPPQPGGAVAIPPRPARPGSALRGKVGSMVAPSPAPPAREIPQSVEIPLSALQEPGTPPTLPPTEQSPLSPPPFSAPPPLPAAALEEPKEREIASLALILGGTVLVLCGLGLACTLPFVWINQGSTPPWTQQIALSAMLANGGLAAGLMILGMGSIFQKRWAPRLIHACGWIGALVSSGVIAAAAWHWANGAGDSGPAVPEPWMLVLSLAALGLPLLMILQYQKPELQDCCDSADPEPGWTDNLPVPGVMLLPAGLITACAAISICFAHHPALPLPPHGLLTGPAAASGWAVLALLGIAASIGAFRRSRLAVWILLAAALLLTAGPAACGLAGGAWWNDFLSALGKPKALDGTGSASFASLLTGLSPLPLFLVLAMARRAFPSPPQT